MGLERNVSVFSGWLENGNNMAVPYPGLFFLPLCTVLFSHLGDGAERMILVKKIKKLVHMLRGKLAQLTL